MKSTLLKIVIAVTVLLGTAYGILWFSPPPAKPALTAAPTDHSIQIGSVERTYTTYLPADLPPGAPLLIMLHGTSMDGRMIRRWTGYAFDELADDGGFAVAYPDGIGGTWNECRREGPTRAKRENVDDLGFLRGMVEAMTRDLGIDPSKVYFVGYSNGAQMVFRMLADAPDITAGIAVAGAGYPTADSHLCQTTWPARPVMIANGTDDFVVPFDGGPATLLGMEAGVILSAVETAHLFVRQNEITAEPRTRILPPSGDSQVEEMLWQEEGKPAVVLYSIIDGGHTLPQPRFRFPRVLGKTNRDLDMPTAAVDFFGLR